jgi:hypothetical protein
MTYVVDAGHVRRATIGGGEKGKSYHGMNPLNTARVSLLDD